MTPTSPSAVSPPGAGTGSWSLQRRLLAALLAAGLVVLAVVGVAGALLVRVRQAQGVVVDDYYRATLNSQRLFIRLVDAETAVRGFALTGQESALEPLAGLSDAGSRQESAELRTVLERDPDVLAAQQRSAAAARRWILEFQVPTVDAVRAGGPRAVTPADIERGKTLFDALRADYGAYLDTLADRREQARDRLTSRTNALFSAVVVTALMGALVALLLWMLLRRWVVRPVAALARETRMVRDGAYDHEVRGSGPRELVQLGSDVDAMRVAVVHQLDRVRAAGEEVERARVRLQEQAADLERSNRDLEQFAYVASHDLQEPLRKVASFCQMLERRYSGQLDERGEQYIAFAVDGAKRMQQLINDLLTFSRVGRMSNEIVDVPVEGCLDRALRNLTAAREESGATVTHDPLPVVSGEGALLTQLLQNLVGNAIKFAGDAPPAVHVGVRDAGPLWEFCCADQGIGIEPQYAERVFVIFQRLHPKDRYEGTGIGLAMCKKIVEYHGGTIWLDVPPEGGRGTTFRWTLPKSAVPAPEALADTTGTPAPAAPAAAEGGPAHAV